MPDVFANITGAPRQALEMIASVLELRASMPQQQEMLRTYLRDINFPDRAKVLEVGCGTGPITRVLAAWPNVGEVVGGDPSPYLIDKARSLSPSLPNLVFEVGDGKALGFQETSFDVVILHTVLMHVPGPEAILAEAHRILRPGGWLGICDGDFSTATLSTGELDPLEVCVHAFVEGFVNDRWMVRRMRGLAATAGFEVSPLRSYGVEGRGEAPCRDQRVLWLHGLCEYGRAEAAITQTPPNCFSAEGAKTCRTAERQAWRLPCWRWVRCALLKSGPM